LNPAPAALARLIGAQICLHACMTGFRMAAPLMALREGYSPRRSVCCWRCSRWRRCSGAAGRALCRPPRPARPVVLGQGVATVGRRWRWPFRCSACCADRLHLRCGHRLAMIALQRHVGRLASNPTELKQVFSWMAIGPSISNFLGPLRPAC
jgi:hypothetical protein